MYRHLELRLGQRVLEILRRKYPDATLPRVIIEQPPNVGMGDFAIPLFPFAKPLRSAPLKIAEEIRSQASQIEGIGAMEVAGPGYLNVRIDRGYLASALARDEQPTADSPEGKALVEHSSINPNKAAHIGHLRNAILGDTFVRLLRSAERTVDVQNYIDNTGVQVADVIVGFLHVEKAAFDEIEELSRQPRFDYYCWDVYARASHWYELDPQNKKARLDTLHAIEQGGNEIAAIADLISTAVLRRHLGTMERLDIEYDFLPRESEILRLHFWDAAFELMKRKGVLIYIDEGKNKGCWVMRRGAPSESSASGTETTTAIAEEDQKVIVRSNGTVGYVGKDIAYHLWKFGLLGKDFEYKEFYLYPNNHQCWISSTDGEPDHPHFGGVSEIYNVIDARQAEAQNAVIDALRALGYEEQANHYTHFSYEMVALTPRCAAELGYELSDEDKQRSWIEVSGRKGFGVKADDLLDTLITSARKEVDARHPELGANERADIARQIAIGALRYFMLKFTKQSVIAFDFKDALSFEGETGPYAQYAVVRATNIFRKGGLEADKFLSDSSPTAEEFGRYLSGEEFNDLWELWLAASKTSYVIDQCIATTEPAYLAKHVFQLAQSFNYFYHRHPILSEQDDSRKRFLLITVAVVRREMIRSLAVLGISVPPVM